MAHAAGRPRDARIDIALRDAMSAMLEESSPHAISLRALTARAGVTRDAFYRRYPSLGHFYVDLALDRYARDPTADTGTLRGDLLVIQREQAELYNGLLARRLLPQLISALAGDETASAAFAERFLAPRRVAYRRAFQRAVDRGEAPPVRDPEYVLDLLSGPIFLRAAMPGLGPIDEAFIAQTVDSVLREMRVSTT